MKKKKINRKLFKEYFFVKTASQLSKSLQNIDDKNKNNVLVNTIRNALSHLKDKIETITKIEKTSKEPDKIVDIVGKIFEFNRPNEDQQPDA